MIPVKIKPGFFITAALIGFLNSLSLLGTMIWIGIIFVSVLVHEYGHALTSKFFGQRPRIELIAFGGLTIPEGKRLRPWKEFIVVFMGPFFGFLLFLGAYILLISPVLSSELLRSVVATFCYVNLFWTFINLLPILPLDGGQLVRIVLESIFGARAWKMSLWTSTIIASVFSLFFFVVGFFLVGAIFLIFAFQSIETIKRFKNLSEADNDDGNRERLHSIEEMIKMGDIQTAERQLEVLIDETESGIIHTLAREILAKLYYDEHSYEKVYHLLSPVEKEISREAKCILYLSAFEIGDHNTVAALSGPCFEERQTTDIAMRAAASLAILQEVRKSVEWLKTAKSFGDSDLSSMLQHPAFDGIRNDPLFQKFIRSLEK